MSKTESTTRTDGRGFRSAFLAAFAIPALLALVAACDQSPIFSKISTETKPKDPIVQGSPGKIVEFNGKAYIANGRLYAYTPDLSAEGGSWAKAAGPGGFIADLAATGTRIFALTVEGTASTATKIHSSTDGSVWSELVSDTGAYTLFSSLHVAGNTLFVGAHEANDETSFALLAYDGTDLNIAKAALGAGGQLVGSAFSGAEYYLATATQGVFISADPLAFGAAHGDTTGHTLTGLVAVGAKVVGLGKEELLQGNSAGFAAEAFGGIDFTGAVAVREAGADDLLLVGIDVVGETYSYGYKEILLSGGAFPASPTLKNPGSGSPTTVTDGDQYDSSLGTVPVRALHQWSGAVEVLFASTYGEGLWSYRGGEWNAEE